MANSLYPAAKEAFLTGGINWASDDIRVIIVDTADYTHSTAHDMLDDVPAAARVAVSGSLTGKTTTGGVADAADTSVAGVTGDPSEALVVYKHTGTETTSRLIAYIDTGSGLPFTPNGGAANITWNASGIFSL